MYENLLYLLINHLGAQNTIMQKIDVKGIFNELFSDLDENKFTAMLFSIYAQHLTPQASTVWWRY